MYAKDNLQVRAIGASVIQAPINWTVSRLTLCCLKRTSINQSIRSDVY